MRLKSLFTLRAHLRISAQQNYFLGSPLNNQNKQCFFRLASTANSVLGGVFDDLGLDTHKELHRLSLEKPDVFWGRLARKELNWSKDFDTVMDCDMTKGKFKWFDGGELNASVNCVDRHAAVDPDRVALIWEQDEPGNEVKITYGELSKSVNQVGNVLRKHGIKKGDVVALYMPAMPLAVISMLACARIGAIHTVIFAGFSPEAVASRIQDSSAVAVITADEAVRGAKKIPLKSTVDKAVEKCPSVNKVFVVKRTGAPIEMQGNEVMLQEAMDAESTECQPETMASEDPLFYLYTSGSSGKPKGISHSTGGYLTFTSVSLKTAFDFQPGDVFGCVADIGWITGHSFVVYGPFLAGGTSVLFESTPIYPNPSRYWEMIQRLKINQFYCAPTAVRLLMKYKNECVTDYDRSSLKTIGSVGEPINHDAWNWLNEVVGDKKCDLVDTWWQTETGGVSLSPRPSEMGAEIIAGKPMRPMFGIDPVLIDDKGQEISGYDTFGALCLKSAWPGIARTILGDHQRFVDTYFSMYRGYFFTGDGGHRDDKGYWSITGRMDDVINVTGHRLGTAEVEDVMDEHEEVAEAAVVGYPHDMKGEGVYAFIILKKASVESEALLLEELREIVKTNIASYAVPDKILFCRALPKTRSGKIMRRILRKIASNHFNELGDISTLAEPTIVQEIVDHHKLLNMK